MKELITAGVDEVGRGCLAGPVVSAAVVLKKSINLNIQEKLRKKNMHIQTLDQLRKNVLLELDRIILLRRRQHYDHACFLLGFLLCT